MQPLPLQRELMVHQQLERRGIKDPRVLAAMRTVPRHAFVEPEQVAHAYADEPLRIPEGQTISQPYVVARMLEAAELTPADRVLEVGAGSGYAAALCSLLARDVFAVERHERLFHLAQARLAQLGYLNVSLRHADGTTGWPEHGPYDAVLVPAAPTEIPLALLDQLAIGGRLVIPVGGRASQKLLRITRTGPNEYEQRALETVYFVPLVPGVTKDRAA